MEKGKIIICDEKDNESDSINFTFNPSSYSISSTPRYKDISPLSTDEEKKEYLGGVSRTLSCTLIFDSFSDVDLFSKDSAKKVTQMTDGIENQLPPITNKLNTLELAAHVNGEVHKPPTVKFIWGNLKFRGVISNLSIEYTMFSMEGKPIRATVNLTISEEKDAALAAKESPFESPDRTKSRVIVEGMSLWSIAYEEYGDCEKWREIAKANNIMNPLDIRPGQVIQIPALDSD